MKGQISIDYYVSLIIFIFFVVYFLFQITNLVPVFIGQMEEQRMRSETYQISELLINLETADAFWTAIRTALKLSELEGRMVEATCGHSNGFCTVEPVPSLFCSVACAVREASGTVEMPNEMAREARRNFSFRSCSRPALSRCL